MNYNLNHSMYPHCQIPNHKKNILNYACINEKCTDKILNCNHCLKNHKCNMISLDKIQINVEKFY